MTFDVSSGVAYGMLYLVLASFTILAFGSANLFPCLPFSIRRWCLLRTPNANNEGIAEFTGSVDYFLAARNAAGMFSIAMSYFAGGMGAWVIYGTPEMGANPQLSWLGVMGYSAASSIPAFLACLLGPKIRSMCGDKCFSAGDYGRKRYGRLMQLVVAAISIFYMFIYIVAELTSLSNVFAMLVGNDSTRYQVSITVSVGIVTLFYTTIAGLPSSIVTDKFQGVLMFILVVTLTIAVTSLPANQVTSTQFQRASSITGQGAMAAVTLFIAICSAELFNQATWQRVWAAQDMKALCYGNALGSLLVFLLMMFFGIMGMIAYAKDHTNYDNGTKYAYMSFFDIIDPLSNGWHVMVLVLVTALSTSTVDTVQNGLASIFSADLVKLGYNPKFVARTFVLLINIPAVALATARYDVISLFLVADLVCATSVLPAFMGLQTTDINYWIRAPTELGAFLGCVSSVAAVLINGAVNHASGGLFGYFLLRNGGICSVCGSKTMISFIVTPIVSLVMTYIFSFLDIMIRGERARRPVFTLAFDKDDHEVESESDSSDEEDLKKVEGREEDGNVEAIAVEEASTDEDDNNNATKVEKNEVAA